jgi:hypothetical protein
MPIRGRILGFTLGAAALTLSGCALDPTYNFDDGTIFKGKQTWETKRHADDWMVPIGDAASVLGLSILAQGIECAIDFALTPAHEPQSIYIRKPAAP